MPWSAKWARLRQKAAVIAEHTLYSVRVSFASLGYGRLKEKKEEKGVLHGLCNLQGLACCVPPGITFEGVIKHWAMKCADKMNLITRAMQRKGPLALPLLFTEAFSLKV